MEKRPLSGEFRLKKSSLLKVSTNFFMVTSNLNFSSICQAQYLQYFRTFVCEYFIRIYERTGVLWVADKENEDARNPSFLTTYTCQ